VRHALVKKYTRQISSVEHNIWGNLMEKNMIKNDEEQHLSRKEIVLKLKQSVFPVCMDENKVIGSCFATRYPNTFISCHHVVRFQIGDNAPELSIRDNHGAGHRFNIEFEEPSDDFAILRTIDFDASINGIELGDESLYEEGDDVFFCGYPFGFDYAVAHHGMVSHKGIIRGRRGIQIDGSINKGNSGGPCVIVEGESIKVVGVIATRLVEVDLNRLKKEYHLLADGHDLLLKQGEKQRAAQLGVFGVLMEIMIPPLIEFNRYVNVGMGEAVMIDALKIWIEKKTHHRNVLSNDLPTYP
jgi:hypothetical protein